MFLTHYNPVHNLLHRLTDLPTEFEKSLVPPVDIVEKDGEWLFSVDLPGVDSQDIDIEIKGDNLVVSATRHNVATQEKDNYRYTERSDGEYKRCFKLPESADGGKVNATTNNGVLEIKVAKRHQSQPRKIAVEAGSATDSAVKEVVA